MSNDNIQQHDGQWNKTTSARLPYNATTAALFSATHPDITFSPARFQAPSIHQQHGSNPSIAPTNMAVNVSPIPTNFAHHHHHHQHHQQHHQAPSHPTVPQPPSHASSSNVPVYPTTVAATSVLTPNPFAAVSVAKQFFHAMNTAATLVGNAAPLNLNTPSPSQIIIPSGMAMSPASNSGLSRTSNVDLPSPSSTSSTGCGNSTLLGSTNTITSIITENVLNAIGGGVTQHATPARSIGFGVKSTPDEEKLHRVHQIVEASVGEQAKQQIVQILDCISTLKPVEKLFLYLRLPGASPETDPLRQPQNPLGTRSEINHTINWVRSHLEQDPHVSIPKQDVYNDYIAYCEREDIKPLSTADFGKVMKQVFPGVRPRRLGTRGHSRYCYAAMRKTTKLPTPQLPQLGSVLSTNKIDDVDTDTAEPINTETWSVIKSWAEGLLQIKLDNAKDLAARIKTGNMPGAVGNIAAGGTRISISHKKFGTRETKEKRLMTDMGPLKKRRKKKRKGSSSSESSYNSQATPQKQSSSDKETLPVTTPTIVTTGIEYVNPLSNESIALVKVKEEFMESPTFQRVQNVVTPNRQPAGMNDNFLQCEEQQQQHQMWPINLAPEQRGAMNQSSSTITTTSAFNVASTLRSTGAAKNLVPKIIELATAAAAAAVATTTTTTTTTLQTPIKTVSLEQQSSDLVPTIKEEFIDEYNTSNIICKKVRKAQQTKGFWQPTTTTPPTTTTTTTTTTAVTIQTATKTTIPVATTIPQVQIVPVITTSSAAITAPLHASQQQKPQRERNVAAKTPSPVSNFLMGPPAAASSTSPFAATSTDTGSVTPTPKVASKNMQQLRAKRLQIAAAAAAAAANEATSSNNPTDDLTENLGLPRERVISICNMDKHELDDYFINGEEEEEDNSNEPDSELLQYFQPGDAEEKLNSLDAGKQRNPTAALSTIKSQSSNVTTAIQLAVPQQQIKQPTPQLTVTVTAARAPHGGALPILTTTTTTSATTLTVGSASASLALLSQKHQQQQQIQLQNPQQSINSTTTKRKLPPAKHCTFAPISPNINGNSASNASSATTNGVHFASPVLTNTRLRPKPSLLVKQHSLDVDLSGAIPFTSPSSMMTTMHDPMIGATRRRRNYVSATSASAPPSPSILRQQQMFNVQQFQNAANSHWLNNNTTNNNSSFLNDQNSNDLDLFVSNTSNANAMNFASDVGIVGAGGGGGVLSFDVYGTETQRSQSVPLSQLQRICSPPLLSNMSVITAIKNNFSIGENSLLCSDNSSSQQSNPISAGIIKLEDPAAVVMASDTAALLDQVDVNEILSSPDFVQNFTSIAQQQQENRSSIIAATTTCSSAGSSSGYSSGGACTTFTGGNSNIMSRSVPSTPLPHHHHHQNLFGQSSVNFYNQRLRDELQLSPCSSFIGGSHTNNNNTNNNNNNVSFSNSFGSRSIYDISKSMPTTPITTPSFRYSPEFNRDFLINGNTVEDSISFGGVGSDSLIGNGDPTNISADDDNVHLVASLNPVTLLTTDDVSVPGADDVLLGNI